MGLTSDRDGVDNPMTELLAPYCEIIKVKSEWACKRCGKSIYEGNYCLGSGWTKYCISCAVYSIKSIEEREEKRQKAWDKALVKVKKQLNSNYQSYLDHNALRKIRKMANGS